MALGCTSLFDVAAYRAKLVNEKPFTSIAVATTPVADKSALFGRPSSPSAIAASQVRVYKARPGNGGAPTTGAANIVHPAVSRSLNGDTQAQAPALGSSLLELLGAKQHDKDRESKLQKFSARTPRTISRSAVLAAEVEVIPLSKVPPQLGESQMSSGSSTSSNLEDNGQGLTGLPLKVIQIVHREQKKIMDRQRSLYQSNNIRRASSNRPASKQPGIVSPVSPVGSHFSSAMRGEELAQEGDQARRSGSSPKSLIGGARLRMYGSNGERKSGRRTARSRVSRPLDTYQSEKPIGESEPDSDTSEPKKSVAAETEMEDHAPDYSNAQQARESETQLAFVQDIPVNELDAARSEQGVSVDATSSPTISRLTTASQTAGKKKISRARHMVNDFTSKHKGKQSRGNILRKGLHGLIEGRLEVPVRSKQPPTDPRDRPTANAAAIDYQVVHWSSQRDNGRYAAKNLMERGRTNKTWESVDAAPQWIVLDVFSDREVSALHMRCAGGASDPKDVQVLRSGTDQGPWVNVKRCYLDMDAQSHREFPLHRIGFDCGKPARYWMLRFSETWEQSSTVSILAPLVVVAEPLDPDVLEARLLSKDLSLTTIFTEAVSVADEEKEMRKLARDHKIPLAEAEHLQEEFRKYDSQGAGSLGYSDFEKVVRAIVGKPRRSLATVNGHSRGNSTSRPQHLPTSAQGGRVPDKERFHTRTGSKQLSDNETIPDKRLKALWQEVDEDGSGRVEFEEFCVWYFTMFKEKEDSSCRTSFHSNAPADSVTERLYSSFGRDRLKACKWGALGSY